jgi:hypothetical protein
MLMDGKLTHHEFVALFSFSRNIFEGYISVFMITEALTNHYNL